MQNERLIDATDQILKQVYPTPKQRVENPKPAVFKVGDWVQIGIGPASGKHGVVVVDRNDNYVDWEPYCSGESIGVSVFEKKELNPIIEQTMVQISGDHEILYHSVVRWFDSPDQLTLGFDSS